MSGTCEPIWKCSSLKQWPRPSALSRSVAASISAVLRPNFAFSPPLSAHLPAPLLQQAGADADQRFDAESAWRRVMMWRKLLELLHDHDHALAELDAQQRHLDEAGVLVAVADDEAAHLIAAARDPAKSSGLLPTSRPKLNGLPASRISSTTSRSWFTLIGNTPRYWPW